LTQACVATIITMAKIRCPGCLKSFEVSAWGQHIALSRQPACHAIFEKNCAYLPGAGYDSDSDVEDLEDLDVDMTPQDFAGDFFGDDYTNEDLPGWGQSDDEEPHWASNSPGSSDSELDSDSESDSSSDSDSDSPPPPDPMDDECGRPLTAEEEQAKADDDVWVNPYVQDFPGIAGKPIDESARKSAFEGYQTNLGDGASANIFAPFQSQMDWEFAKWSKLRGPSSTATTELLGIDNVEKHSGA
jgi:hypothetical protein